MQHHWAQGADLVADMKILSLLRQRTRDWLHEREIRRLGRGCAEAMDAHDAAKTAYFWAATVRAVNARSPTQVARMERAKGLR